MRNGRFHTSKCRGKLEKMGALCSHSPKSPSPFPKLPKQKFSKKLEQFIEGQALASSWRATVGRQPAQGP
jgi:hypothetical protein